MTDFYWQLHKTSQTILSAMALGLGLSDENYFLPTHPGHNNQLRLLHYPPVPAAALEGPAMTRMPAHSDWPTMTMLFQDDCGGLQIENPHKPGDFINIPPLNKHPNAIIINIDNIIMQ